MQLHKNSHNATLQSHYKSIRSYGENIPKSDFTGLRDGKLCYRKFYQTAIILLLYHDHFNNHITPFGVSSPPY